jgi:hypothetical protein
MHKGIPVWEAGYPGRVRELIEVYSHSLSPYSFNRTRAGYVALRG